MTHRDEEVRPYWGETVEVLSGPEYDRQPRPTTRTFQERREAKIADGDCPLPGCGGRLDEAWYCSQCGQVSLPGQTPETPAPLELPRYPLALTIPVDEFAPAEVDAA